MEYYLGVKKDAALIQAAARTTREDITAGFHWHKVDRTQRWGGADRGVTANQRKSASLSSLNTVWAFDCAEVAWNSGSSCLHLRSGWAAGVGHHSSGLINTLLGTLTLPGTHSSYPGPKEKAFACISANIVTCPVQWWWHALVTQWPGLRPPFLTENKGASPPAVRYQVPAGCPGHRRAPAPWHLG